MSEATEGTWAGFHGSAKFSKEVEREWELVQPLVFEGLQLREFPYAGTGKRPVKTLERAVAIAKEIFAGMPAKWAGIYCGLGESTFYEWQAADPEFAELIKRARGARMRSLVKIVRDQAPQTWIAAMTMLERLEFEDFGRTNKVRHSHEGTVGIEVRPMLASPEQIEHIAALEASYEDSLSDEHTLPPHQE